MPEARIRATTFPIRYQAALLTSRQWGSKIRRAIRTANRIYGGHNIPGMPRISFTLSNDTHLSYEASAALLTRNVREQMQDHGISPHAAFRSTFRMERLGDQYIHERRSGFTGRFRFGGFTLDSPGQSTDESTGRTYQRVSNEALAILQMNRSAGEIATYWVPGFSSGAYGIAYFPEKHPDVSRQTEGIFISYHSRDDILAHELGHLLMRAGHCSYDGEGGGVEGSAPETNLMHDDNRERTGTDLTRGQIQRMLVQGRPYLR